MFSPLSEFLSPVENLLNGSPGLEECLSNWNFLHESCCMFLLCSE